MSNQSKLPKDVRILKYIYAFVCLVSAFSAVFSNPFAGVIFCGKSLGHLSSIIVNGVLIIFPLLLYFGFSKPTVTIWYLAFLYHIFFIGNCTLNLLAIFLPNSSIVPLLTISGKSLYVSLASESSHLSTVHLFSLFNLTMLLGIFVLWHLWQEREVFVPKRFLKNI